MGYTHYLRNKPAFTAAQWSAFCNDVRNLLRKTNIPFANAAGEPGTDAYIGKNEIMFNGVGDDAHETCHIIKEAESFSFCKTAHKPYDKLVVEVYKLVRKYLPSTELSSDGGDAVFGNVVVVETDEGKRFTYSAGDFKVSVGDYVILPMPEYRQRREGPEWTAEVVSTESDYEGPLVEILGVLPKADEEVSVPVPSLQSELTGVLAKYVAPALLAEAVAVVQNVVSERLK